VTLATFVLIHSPLVGPLTWSLVADELRHRGIPVVVPALSQDEEDERPYWRQHVAGVVRALAPLPHEQPLVLVGHSGAGILLPAVREASGRPVIAYVFVDAGIPEDGKSRLDLLEIELPEAAEQLRPLLAAGERFPQWSDEELAEVIPERTLRQGMLAELRPQSLRFFEEPIPVFAGWPDAPCAYLQFTPGYDVPARLARREGWAIVKMEGEHFHTLVDPAAVVDAFTSLIGGKV